MSYDPERVRRDRSHRQTVGLALFAPLWPEVAAARVAEQRTLPLEGTTAGLYAAWRAQPESEQVITTLRRIARDWLATGPRRATIGPRTLWEAARRDMVERRLGRWVDNRLQALAVREVEETTPDLHGKFRHRELKESVA